MKRNPLLDARLRKAGVDFDDPCPFPELRRRYGQVETDSAAGYASSVRVCEALITRFRQLLKTNAPAWIVFINNEPDKASAIRLRDDHNRYLRLIVDVHEKHLEELKEKASAFDDIMKDIFAGD